MNNEQGKTKKFEDIKKDFEIRKKEFKIFKSKIEEYLNSEEYKSASGIKENLEKDLLKISEERKNLENEIQEKINALESENDSEEIDRKNHELIALIDRNAQLNGRTLGLNKAINDVNGILNCGRIMERDLKEGEEYFLAREITYNVLSFAVNKVTELEGSKDKSI